MNALIIYEKWEGKEKFYQMLLERGTLGEDLIPPRLGAYTFYLEAYSELSTCRTSGFGISQISILDIYSYADRFDLGEFFVTVIRKLDISYVRHQQQKNNKEKNKSAKSGL